jgi:hypothetical protein
MNPILQFKIQMTPFTYTYHGRECMGNFLPSDKGRGWIKVFFFDHSAVILPAGIKTSDDKMIWVQCVQQGELVWPHDLLQALAEGIEKTSIPG